MTMKRGNTDRVIITLAALERIALKATNMKIEKVRKSVISIFFAEINLVYIF